VCRERGGDPRPQAGRLELGPERAQRPSQRPNRTRRHLGRGGGRPRPKGRRQRNSSRRHRRCERRAGPPPGDHRDQLPRDADAAPRGRAAPGPAAPRVLLDERGVRDQLLPRAGMHVHVDRTGAGDALVLFDLEARGRAPVAVLLPGEGSPHGHDPSVQRVRPRTDWRPRLAALRAERADPRRHHRARHW
jgi:hypothetical protein